MREALSNHKKMIPEKKCDLSLFHIQQFIFLNVIVAPSHLIFPYLENRYLHYFYIPYKYIFLSLFVMLLCNLLCMLMWQEKKKCSQKIPNRQPPRFRSKDSCTGLIICWFVPYKCKLLN